MKKSIFLFFAAILCAMTANAETYRYSGEKDGWAGTEMTASTDGFYSYYGPVTGEHKFKIGTSADQWAYNHSYVSKGFNNTDITDIGDWGSDNCYTWTSATHYILVYYPNTTINSDSKVKICASTFLPDDSETDLPEPEPVADVTIYFVNTKAWSSVNAYVWDNSDNSYKAWPGEAMTSTGDKAHGYDVYSYTFPETYTNCIFNGNGQTDDLTVNAGQYYDIASKTWYATLAEVPNPTPAVMETVYFINTGNWGKVNAYAWTSSNNGWPGAEMTPEAEQIAGFDVYSFTAEQGQWANLIFNNGEGTQTGDLEWQAGKYYAPLKNEWYETKEAAAEALAAPVEYEYVYLINTNDWAAANIYTWTPEVAGWPGAAMTLEAEQIAGKDVYSYKVVKGTTFGGLNFNCGGDECKTGDLTWEAGKYYAPSTGEWYADAAAAEAALAAVVIYDYYIAGTENLTGYNWKENGLGMTKEGDVYKHTFSEMNAGTYEFKITDGTWTNPWGFSNLAANYVGVEQGKDGEGNYNGNIKIVTEEAKNIIVIFDPANNEITLEGWEEAAPAEPVTVYFINSGEWAEVACHYWGGLNGSEWPGVQMDLTAETYEAEGWEVYAITFPGDNTSCIFNDNKAEGATQTGNLEVHDGQYYCYENGIWYELLADVDPLDTRVYLKGQMNEWCNNGYCDMFRKEDMNETVAYRTTWLDANTTYEFKIESAGAWLSYAQAVTKDNCTDLTFEEGGNNCTITTEYAGEYLFIWDMTTNKLSVVYPDPKANPTVMDIMVTNMVFDGEMMTFSGSANAYGIAFNLVVGDMIEEGVFALDASSTVDAGGTPFTDVTGTITPDMSMGMPTAATAIVYGFLDGMYFQLNVDMSAGGGTPVEIWDGVATPNDVTGELTISANWDGDDVYVVVPGFDYTNYECPEVWFYIGGTTWETASIAAYGPATITVEDGGVLVEDSVISGITGTQYELMVFGLLPVEETPDYTRAVTENQWGTICLPNASSSFTGATFYEVSSLDPAKGLWLDQLAAGAQLEAGKPYIFQATATEITVTYTDAAPVDDPVPGAKGLTGTFDGIAADSVLVGNYIIADNKVWVANENNDLPANRAYINASVVPKEAQAVIPGRRRVCMGENATTGFDQIVAPAGQAVKAIENGQLIIIRDGVKYNVQGQKL